MIVPNKIIPLEESALGKISVILERGPQPIDLLELYQQVAKQFESLDQFLLSLDVLFVLGKIEVDPATRSVTYVS